MRREKVDNRSLAIADMIARNSSSISRNAATPKIVGTITLVYDHHRMHVQGKRLRTSSTITHDVILSTVHVHLDHHNNCLEVLIVKGRAAVVKKIADRVDRGEGVKHGQADGDHHRRICRVRLGCLVVQQNSVPTPSSLKLSGDRDTHANKESNLGWRGLSRAGHRCLFGISAGVEY